MALNIENNCLVRINPQSINSIWNSIWKNKTKKKKKKKKKKKNIKLNLCNDCSYNLNFLERRKDLTFQ